MKITLTVVFSFLTLVSFTQVNDTIILYPGHPILTGKSLKNYSCSYEFLSIKDGHEQKIGYLLEQFKIIKSGHELEGLRICNIQFGQIKILDSGLCKMKTLQPIYHRSTQTKRKMAFDFNKQIINGTVINLDTTKQSIDTIHYTITQPLFDSYFEDIVAKSFDFKKALLFKFPEFIYERGGLVWSNGKIEGYEIIKNKNGEKIKAWKIKLYELNNKNDIIRETSYLITDKDRSILWREYKMTNSTIILRQINN